MTHDFAAPGQPVIPVPWGNADQHTVQCNTLRKRPGFYLPKLTEAGVQLGRASVLSLAAALHELPTHPNRFDLTLERDLGTCVTIHAVEMDEKDFIRA